MELFISFEQARDIIMKAVGKQPKRVVGFEDALGMTLAEPVVSNDQIPPFANSAMDGYAVRVDDFQSLPVNLQILGHIPAGAVPDGSVVSGTCMKIMTGAPFPGGADAVVPIEWVTGEEGDRVTFDRAPVAGQHVRPAGQDVQRNELVLESGQVVTPPVTGMLATLGYSQVSVCVPPTVAVIATGDELIHPGEALSPGKIRNSSGSALRAQVLAAGGSPMGPYLARDNKESIEEVLREALQADMLLFAGGVSVGDYDLVKQVLDDFGLDLLFWKIKQRPGKPLAFGLLQEKPVFGLPGNPVSSAMCFEQYVRPAIAQMLGRSQIYRPLYPAYLSHETKKVKGLHFFARGIASFDETGKLRVRDTGPQASNLYSSVVRANCIFHMPADLEAAPAGTPVQLEWLSW